MRDARSSSTPGRRTSLHLDTVAERAGEVAAVLLTHHHADHSEAAREFAERMGCGVRALDPAYRLGSEGLGDGDVVEVDGLEIRVVATPGHTADSLSFLVPADGAVLTGDTVLGRGTTVVAHPDGQLGAYLGSLDRLHALASEHGLAAIWPGHGPVIDDALGALDFYRAHRRERLAQVEAAVARLRGDGADAADRRRTPATPCPGRSSRSCTPTSTRCSGVPRSCPCAPSWPTSPRGPDRRHAERGAATRRAPSAPPSSTSAASHADHGPALVRPRPVAARVAPRSGGPASSGRRRR